jgi:hypothetical protein
MLDEVAATFEPVVLQNLVCSFEGCKTYKVWLATVTPPRELY